MAVTPDVVYLVNADGVYAVGRRAYTAAVEDAKKLDAERQALETQLAELKKAPVDGSSPVSAEELAKKLEEPTQKLAQAIAQRARLKDSAYLWRYGGKQYTAVIQAGDLVVAGGPGIVVGLEASSGKEVWRQDVDGLAVGLAVADGRLVVSTDTGCVHCFGEGAATGRTFGGTRVENPYPNDALAETCRAAARRFWTRPASRKAMVSSSTAAKVVWPTNWPGSRTCRLSASSGTPRSSPRPVPAWKRLVCGDRELSSSRGICRRCPITLRT